MQNKSFRVSWALTAPIALSLLGATFSIPALAQTGHKKSHMTEQQREQQQDINGAREHARLKASNAARRREGLQDIQEGRMREQARLRAQKLKGEQERARLKASNAARRKEGLQDIQEGRVKEQARLRAQKLKGERERALYEQKYHHAPGHKLAPHRTDHDHDKH